MKRIFVLRHIETGDWKACLAQSSEEALLLAAIYPSKTKEWEKLSEHSVEDWSKKEAEYNRILNKQKPN